MSDWDERRAELAGERGAALPRNATSPALANSILVKAGAGLLFGFVVFNTNAAAQYLQVFDQPSLPADGAVPDIVFELAASTHLPIEYLRPRTMDRGIVMCNSSTAGTKTIGAADCLFDVQYL